MNNTDCHKKTDLVFLLYKDATKNMEYVGMWIMSYLICFVIQHKFISIGKAHLFFNMLYPVINLLIFLYLFSGAMSAIIVPEKVSGRIESYLANQVKLSTLIKTYSLTSFALSFIPVILFNIATQLIDFIIWHIDSYKTIFSLRYMLFGISLLIVCVSFSFFATILSLSIKKPDNIRVGIMVTTFIILALVVFLSKLFTNFGVFLYSLSLIHALIGAALICACFLLKSKLSNEKIILSYKY